MTTVPCPDAWHRGRFAAAYVSEVRDDGGVGFRCRTCGFRTVEITDDAGRDITDEHIVSSYTPRLARRIRESITDWRDSRSSRRISRGTCQECRQHKPALAYGKSGYTCTECFMARL